MSELVALTDSLRAELRRPTLVVGPSVTSHVSVLSELQKTLNDDFPIPEGSQPPLDYLHLADQLLVSGELSKDVLQTRVEDYFKSVSASALVTRLLRVRWSAIVSLTSDTVLEDALRSQTDKIPSSIDVTVVDHPSVVPRIRTIPVYKLLGNVKDSRDGRAIVCCQSDLLLRQRSWGATLATLPDRIREGPMVFVGTDGIVLLVRDFLSALYAARPPHPSNVLFLKDDLTPQDPTTASLITSRSQCHILDASLRAFCEFAATAQSESKQLVLPLVDSTKSQWERWKERFSEFEHIVDVVPHGLSAKFDRDGSRNRIVDALFRPTSLDWLPFLCDYDLRRTQGAGLKDCVTKYFAVSERTRTFTVVLRGEAGIGKSVSLKRLAVDLASDRALVFWCRRPPVEGWVGEYSKFATALRDLVSTSSAQFRPPLVVICDQAWSLGVSPYDLAFTFERLSVPVVLVLSFRNTDYLQGDAGGLPLPSLPDDEVELSFNLDGQELAALPEFLVRIGAATGISDALKAVEQTPTSNAADILCSLWYLVPTTRGQITSSLQYEYCRLGASAAAVTAFSGLTEQFGAVARQAYEFVAVCSNLNVGIPLEVLVHALRIAYREWIDMCSEGKPIWGLLYDDEAADETVVYFTRNEVVTRVLVDHCKWWSRARWGVSLHERPY